MTEVLHLDRPSFQLIIDDAYPEDTDPICRMIAEAQKTTLPNAALGITQQMVHDRHYDESGNIRPEKLEEMYQKITSPKELGHVFTARIGQQIVGVVAPRIQDDGVHRLGSLYVLPEFRGKGVGSPLIRKSCIWHGPNDIWLQVATYNENAINFYQYKGFRIAGLLDMEKSKAFPGGEVVPYYRMVREAA